MTAVRNIFIHTKIQTDGISLWNISYCKKNVTLWNEGTFTLASAVEDVFKWNDMQSFGKALVDLYRHDFCKTEFYFQN